MWLSVAFPTCPSCMKNSNKCYHRNCPEGAKEPMEIDPESSFVHCPSCDKSWNIKESSYYCSCGYVFSADDVSIELDAIVANARLIVQEMKRAAETQKRINDMTTADIEVKAEQTIKKTFGEKLWESLKGLLPTIVLAIKTWLQKE